MSNFEDFQVGDRVRAVSRDGDDNNVLDSAEFLVVGIQPLVKRLLSRYSVYSFHDYSFTLLDRPKPPLPTAPGVYGLGAGMKYMMLTTEYGWLWLDFTSPDGGTSPVSADMLRLYADYLTLVYEQGSEFKS